MNQTLSSIIRGVQRVSPALAIIGVVGGCAYAIYKTFKESPKVHENIKEATEAKGAPLTVKEKLHASKPLLKPAIVFACAVAILVVFGVSTHKKISNLTAQLAGSVVTSAATNNAGNIVDQVKHERGRSPQPEAHAIPTGRCIWVEEYTGVNIEATYADVVDAYARINAYLQTTDTVTIADFLDCFDTTSTGAAEYPKTATMFGWVNNEYSRVPRIEPDLYTNEAAIKHSGLPVITLGHTIEPEFLNG